MHPRIMSPRIGLLFATLALFASAAASAGQLHRLPAKGHVKRPAALLSAANPTALDSPAAANLSPLAILHSFSDGSVPNDGKNSYAALVQDADGNFYGTTYDGGSTATADPNHFGDGTVFKLLLTPAITSFSPASGPIGTVVTITGMNLINVTRVRFHNANATTYFPRADGTALTVTVPQGAATGTITITTPNGSIVTSMPFRVTYTPAISSISPTSGPVGTVATITGMHLTGITRVRFHEADATVYSSNAAGTQLTVTVPTGAATGTITLDNRNALATTSKGIFTVTH